MKLTAQSSTEEQNRRKRGPWFASYELTLASLHWPKTPRYSIIFTSDVWLSLFNEIYNFYNVRMFPYDNIEKTHYFPSTKFPFLVLRGIHCCLPSRSSTLSLDDSVTIHVVQHHTGAPDRCFHTAFSSSRHFTTS